MRRLPFLVGLFAKQLARQKSLWIVAAVLGSTFLIGHLAQRGFEQALGEGESVEIATRRAVAVLEDYAEQARRLAVVLVLMVSALVAPRARRDGTVQFLDRKRLGLGPDDPITVGKDSKSRILRPLTFGPTEEQ